jgi:hypothetical protein
MIRRPGHTFRISRALGVAAVALSIATVSCGPELNSPASSDVSGTWFAAGPSAGFTNITVNVTQNPDGTISGTYTATADPSLGLCGSTAVSTAACLQTGTLTGANTVFQVFFAINGVGQFTGQLIGGTTLKGAMSRLDVTQPIEFTKS